MMREASKQRRNPEEKNILACTQNCQCSGKDKYKNVSTRIEKKKKETFGRESTITEENWHQKPILNYL